MKQIKNSKLTRHEPKNIKAPAGIGHRTGGYRYITNEEYAEKCRKWPEC